MDKNFLSRFIKGVASTSIGTFFQIVLGFFGLMVAVRFIPKEQFGVFILIQVIALFFVMFSSLALENISVTKLIVSAENNKKMKVANTAICYKFIIAIIMSLVILLCRPLIYYIFKSEQLSQLLIYIPLFFLLSSFDELLLKILQGFHLYKKMAISQVINGLVKFLLIVIFLVVLKMNVVGLIYAFLFSFTASILFQYLVIPVKKQFNFNPKLFRKIFKFGFPLGLNSILTFIFTKIDRFMIGAMISPVGVAYYEIAARIPDNCRRMYQSFQSVFFPNMSELFAQKRYKDAEKVLNNSLRLVSFVTIFSAFVIMLFQKDIVRLLFSEQYLESAPALSLLMVSLNMALIGNIMGTTLVAAGYSDKPVKINIFATIFNVLGNIIMIPIFGFMGAVYATLFTNYFTNSTISIWFLKRNNINIKTSGFFKPILVFVVCLFLFLMFNPNNILIKLFLICIFLIFCIFLSVISRRDFDIIKSNIKLRTTPLFK